MLPRATSSLRRQRLPALVLLLCLLTLLGGCKRKKQTAAPPAAQAPTIAAPPPAPAPAVAPTPAAPPATESKPAETAPAAAKPKPKPKSHVARKPAPAAPAAEIKTPGKTIVPEGGATPTGTQLAPDLAPAQAIETRQSTTALLEATEKNLKSLPRQLTADEQAMVEQINTYMAQSRSATAEGDLIRARNLADKGYQLSQALLKRD